MLFIKIILAHLLGDFLLQPKKWVVHKEVHKAASKYLYIHVLLHFLLYLLFFWNLQVWYLALAIALGHLLIDLIKLYIAPYFKNQAVPFLADQLLHIGVIYICLYFKQLPTHFIQMVEHTNWVLVTAIFFLSYPAAIIMTKLLEGMSSQIETNHRSLSNAGKYIGILERLFVLTFIILGQWEGIGLLITAKSVFRFNDLKESNNRKLTEYILIGTLVSFGLAMLTGILFNYFSLANSFN
jgi:hypothetical protein